MSAHTPGPWFHSNASLWGCVTTQPDGHGHVVAEVDSPPTGKGSLDPARVVETNANARLIAAAPDLLAALVGLTTQPIAKAGWSKSWDDAMDAARVAIAKAEGKS